ncbi:DNA polymerase II [Candidatus Pacearchaeota archaeon CG10_big_fil_rev_8_21_14_0_10_31_9]|nr:MAG: DNA polymerase II [Candidatus Pacearchaeota archaeon CG10_big_fil_rev_8_21_14_0_10_31_9]
MQQEVLNFCMYKGILLDKEILDVLGNLRDIEVAKHFIEKIDFQYKQKIITKSFFIKNSDKVCDILLSYKGDSRKLIKEFFLSLGLDLSDIEKSKDCATKIKDSNEQFVSAKVFQNQPKKLEVKDFVNNFRNRYSFLKGILQQRHELDNLISINRISEGSFSIIAMVSDKKTTKNGNIILELEDLTGKINALVTKNRPEAFEKSKEILLDEVIGLKCNGNKEIIFVSSIFFPDAFIQTKKFSKTEEIVAFISDIHVGSDKFLKENFEKFIRWLNGEVGNKEQKEEALKIKYLFITGDTVDGVGVYPGQETQLLLKDVKEQYRELASLLSKIRSDVNIIMCAGQHDAVRVAEPQPIITESYAQPLYFLKNLKLVTNPSIVEIGQDTKFKVLMYHGASMHGVINSIEKLRIGRGHDSPAEVVKYLLRKRHLAPSHSLVTYTPLDGNDALLIQEVPDVIATGDLHRPEVSDYNGVTIITSSCWQSRTPFEEKVGNNPDPCKVPILNLKSREIKIIDFSDNENK